MKSRIRKALVLVVILAACANSCPVSAEIVWAAGIAFEQRNEIWYLLDDFDQEWEVVPGRVVVRFDNSIGSSLAPTALSDLGLSLVGPRADIGGYYRFSYDPDRAPPSILETTLRADHVVDAYLDTKLKFFGTSDTYFSNQWNLVQTRTDKAWDITAGDSSVTIAVLDAGFELGHEDLRESIWVDACWDYVDGDSNPSPVNPGNEHGTAVAVSPAPPETMERALLARRAEAQEIAQD